MISNVTICLRITYGIVCLFKVVVSINSVFPLNFILIDSVDKAYMFIESLTSCLEFVLPRIWYLVLNRLESVEKRML